MSNNWKKRVSDFFFEEIEVEIEEIKEQNGDPVYRSHPTHQKPVNTKVAYHYPKNNKATFSFPVIPDKINQNRKIEEKKEQNCYQDYRTQNTHKKPVNTKVAYQYPKNNKTPFRFPDIPDDINQNRKQETIMQHRHQQPIRKTRRPYNENMTFDSK